MLYSVNPVLSCKECASCCRAVIVKRASASVSIVRMRKSVLRSGQSDHCMYFVLRSGCQMLRVLWTCLPVRIHILPSGFLVMYATVQE